MKKIILTTALSTSLIVSSVYAAGPATSGAVISGEGSYSSITNTVKLSGTNDKSSYSTGFGLGAYVGYDFAITNSIAIGAKTGYFHSFGIGKVSGDNIGPTIKATTNNIPVLLNTKYYFNSGLYLGAETGVNFQLIHYTGARSGNSKWNAQYVIGGLVGYQINDNISVDGSLDYMTGHEIFKDANNADGRLPTETNKDEALANIKFGIAVNFKLPM